MCTANISRERHATDGRTDRHRPSVRNMEVGGNNSNNVPIPTHVSGNSTIQHGCHSGHFRPHNPWGRLLAVPAFLLLLALLLTLGIFATEGNKIIIIIMTERGAFFFSGYPWLCSATTQFSWTKVSKESTIRTSSSSRFFVLISSLFNHRGLYYRGYKNMMIIIVIMIMMMMSKFLQRVKNSPQIRTGVKRFQFLRELLTQRYAD